MNWRRTIAGEAFARIDVPEAESLIVCCGDKSLAAGEKGNGSERLRVPAEAAIFDARSIIPKHHVTVHQTQSRQTRSRATSKHEIASPTH